jgi:hypothetical protein
MAGAISCIRRRCGDRTEQLGEKCGWDHWHRAKVAAICGTTVEHPVPTGGTVKSLEAVMPCYQGVRQVDTLPAISAVAGDELHQ